MCFWPGLSGSVAVAEYTLVDILFIYMDNLEESNFHVRS